MAINIRDREFEGQVEKFRLQLGNLGPVAATKALAAIGMDALRKGRFTTDPHPSDLVTDPAEPASDLVADPIPQR